jgi:hypothetical protein
LEERRQPKVHRKPVTRADLEQRLTEVIRTSYAEFETFAGLINRRASCRGVTRKRQLGIRGARHGRVNRNRSSAIPSHRVEEVQLEFEITD